MINAKSIKAGAFLGAIVIALSASAACAAPITVEFEGHMSWVDDPFGELDDSFFFGALLSGGFTFDPDAAGPDLFPQDPNVGSYSLDYPLWLEAGTLAVATSPFRLSVVNGVDGNPEDRLLVSSVDFEADGHLYDGLVIFFEDPSGMLYDGIQVPDTIVFEDFLLVSLGLVFEGNTPAFGGWIDTMTVTPEPSSALVVALGLAFLLHGGPNSRRKRRAYKD